MKTAQGYVTDDGTFFEDKLEATLYEAELKLRGRLVALNDRLNPDEVLAIVIETMPEMWRYIDAYKAANTVKRDQQAKEQNRKRSAKSPPSETVEGRGHVSATEEDLISLLKLPTRGPLNVSDVGSSPRPKKVPDGREVDGT